jgi:uncharacterized protein YjbJ (UPF0337 family)
MDKDRIVGAAHQVKGAVKETVGKLTGDAKTQAEGAAEKAAGKVQNIVGATGGKYGPRDPALAIGCTHSDNHPARSDLALSELIGRT